MHQASGRSGKRSPANGGMSSAFTGGLMNALIFISIDVKSRFGGATQSRRSREPQVGF